MSIDYLTGLLCATCSFSIATSSQNFLIGERDTYRGNTSENRGCLFIGERAKRARQY